MVPRICLAVLLAAILVGCTTPAQTEPALITFTVAVPSATPTLTSEPTVTPLPPTSTSTPVPTETHTPEPSPTPINEHDMEIHFEDKMENREFMGVKFNGSVIVDESISSKIDKVTITDGVHAEFLARTIFKVWWDKGNVDHEGLPTEDDFKAFMALWSTAQQTNDPKDWEAVQFTIWANNLDNGDGYVQEPTVVWPMVNEETAGPEGVFGMKEFSNVLVRSGSTKNVTKFMWKGSTEVGAAGTNFDSLGSICEYVSIPFGHEKNINTIIGSLASIATWIKLDKGKSERSAVGSTGDKSLINLLEKGLRVYFSN